MAKRWPYRRGLAWALGGAVLAVAVPGSARAFDPAIEAQNYNKGQERQTIYDTPEYQLLLNQVSQQNAAAAAAMQASDPERNFLGHLCGLPGRACAGDARLYDWEAGGYGLVKAVLFTARDGATISGHVWATRAGPAKRPAIVITNGSIQAPENLYWFVAQTLAKAGYVVLTSDPQGQGQSDERGEAPDQNEGTPAQSDGRPFFDGTEDAINFLLSDASHPYVPVASCGTGTSHAAKQDRRVQAGLDAAYNPFWQLVDKARLGIAGHSYGAAGVSYIGQWDSRVKAIVAWDNLGGTDPNAPFGGSGGRVEQPCPANPAARSVAAITKPALGMSADYFIPPQPNTSDPDPLAKSRQSMEYSKRGVDTGELIIRGGTHYDFSWLPDSAFPATLRGADMINWYTTAWFDKYVKGDCTADRRLLTDRWRHDSQEAAIDQPNRDGDMFSFYYRSRLDFHLADGQRYTNERLRDNASGLSANDGYPATYSYVTIDRSADAANTSFGQCPVGPTSAATRRLELSVSPRRVRSGDRVRFRFRVLTPTGRASAAVHGATVSFAGRRVRTDARGRASIRARLTGTGARRARAIKGGFAAATATVLVLPRPRAGVRFTG
ncbi:MAG: hypothetical protein M3155_03130 [Actinomycetota bacterium]|nr:hypothetical protein [Actinomycetota bacterium]